MSDTSNDKIDKHILVLGAGNFGTCLAQHLAEKGYNVTLWSNSAAIVDSIQQFRKNPKYLSTLTLSQRIAASKSLDAATVGGAQLVVCAVPTQGMRSVLTEVAPHLTTNVLLACANKGIELGTLKLPYDIVSDVLGKNRALQTVFVSGPSFALEVADHQPTAVVAASFSPDKGQKIQDIFHAAYFRVYTSDDPVGVEVAGALKNVIAIASGAASGMGFQMNTRAAIITRGLLEMCRIGVALGANPMTFSGLSGVGDLFLTCSSEKSRNFSVGYSLGKGQPLQEVLDTLGSVSEGVATSRAAFELARKLNVETPIIDEVYHVLYESKPIRNALADLINRDAKAEH